MLENGGLEMYNPYKVLWQYIYGYNPRMSYVQLKRLPVDFRELLIAQKFLLQTENATSIFVGEDLFEVHAVVYKNSDIKYFYNDECGIPQKVASNELLLYKVSFAPLASFLRTELNCRGEIEDLVNNKLWKIGSVGSQRREVYLVRCWDSDATVQQIINDSKDSTIIFYMGNTNGKIPSEKEQLYYDVKTLISFSENGIDFDGQEIIGNIADMVASRTKKTSRRNQQKQEEYQQKAETLLVAWFRYKYENDKRSRQGRKMLSPAIDLKFINQKTFAEELDVPQSAITRMKDNWDKDILGNGYTYKLLLEILGKKTPDYFIDFYNQHKERMIKIGIEY